MYDINDLTQHPYPSLSYSRHHIITMVFPAAVKPYFEDAYLQTPPPKACFFWKMIRDTKVVLQKVMINDGFCLEMNLMWIDFSFWKRWMIWRYSANMIIFVRSSEYQTGNCGIVWIWKLHIQRPKEAVISF